VWFEQGDRSVADAALVDPAFFARLETIELRARGIVEGFLQGLHRSPFVGFSVEFASHREYVAGDDPRHINWKLYARQKRLYVKEFDAETNLDLHIFVDYSRSMDCALGGMRKRDYATTLAAALAHLALRQRDAVGLTIYADEVLAHLEPKARVQQFDAILQALATATPRATRATEQALGQAVELARHRGLVVIIGDCFDDLAGFIRGLERLRYRSHEVLLFHLFDPWERRLPEDGNLRFRDLETGEEIVAQAEGIREEYQRRVDAFCAEVERECLNRAVERVELTTDQPLDKALLDYFVTRARRY